MFHIGSTLDLELIFQTLIEPRNYHYLEPEFVYSNLIAFQDLEFGDWGAYKMVLVVRHDLGMGKGKAAAQVKDILLKVTDVPILFLLWIAC